VVCHAAVSLIGGFLSSVPRSYCSSATTAAVGANPVGKTWFASSTVVECSKDTRHISVERGGQDED
jgi:hypothetical protein